MRETIGDLGTFLKETMVTTQMHALLMSVQELARKNGVHHVPVMHSDRLVGIVCTCDMMLAPPDTQIRHVMKKAVTLSFEDTLEDAARLMKEHVIGSVVLVRGSAPCGIVTRGDVFSGAPEVARSTALPRCACCGIARHLRSTVDGMTKCIFCAGGDA